MQICSQSSEHSTCTQSDEYSRCCPMKIECTVYLHKIEMIAMVPSSTFQNTAIFCESRDKWTRTRTNVATVEHGVQNLRLVKSLCLLVEDEIPIWWVELNAKWWLAWCISTPSQTFVSSSVFIKRYTQEINWELVGGLKIPPYHSVSSFISLNGAFSVSILLKTKPKAMSMNEFRSAPRVENLRCCNEYVFAQLTYLITYGSGALNAISCEVLWTGREENWAENFALSENQAMGARISSFALIVGQQFL